jgi:hypothetical protein
LSIPPPAKINPSTRLASSKFDTGSFPFGAAVSIGQDHAVPGGLGDIVDRLKHTVLGGLPNDVDMTIEHPRNGGHRDPARSATASAVPTADAVEALRAGSATIRTARPRGLRLPGHCADRRAPGR